MGTRLYIETDNATLEAILGVPSGTWAKMVSICQNFGDSHSDEAYERREAEFDKHEGTGLCYDFDLFGFGKLNSDQWALVRRITPNEDDMWCGSSEDPAVISSMLALSSRDRADAAWVRAKHISKISWS